MIWRRKNGRIYKSKTARKIKRLVPILLEVKRLTQLGVLASDFDIINDII